MAENGKTLLILEDIHEDARYIRKRVDDLHDVSTDHEGRISTIEGARTERNWLVGILMASAGLVGATLGKLLPFFK